MDLTQIVVLLSIVSITVIIVISGIYFIQILKDLKVISSSVAKPLKSIGELVTDVSHLYETFTKFFNKPSKEEAKTEHKTTSHPKTFLKQKR